MLYFPYIDLSCVVLYTITNICCPSCINSCIRAGNILTDLRLPPSPLARRLLLFCRLRLQYFGSSLLRSLLPLLLLDTIFLLEHTPAAYCTLESSNIL